MAKLDQAGAKVPRIDNASARVPILPGRVTHRTGGSPACLQGVGLRLRDLAVSLRRVVAGSGRGSRGLRGGCGAGRGRREGQ
jgi:hypothetical protein